MEQQLGTTPSPEDLSEWEQASLVEQSEVLLDLIRAVAQDVNQDLLEIHQRVQMLTRSMDLLLQPKPRTSDGALLDA